MAVILTVGSALAVSSCLTWMMVQLAPSALIVHPSDGRVHRVPTPTAGGLAIFSGFAVAVLAGAYGGFLESGSILVLAGIIGAVALGLFDDAAVLRPATKLGMEILVAAFLATVGPRFRLPDPTFNWTLTALWLLITMNAVNLTDGVDGLAGSLGAISATTIATIGALHGEWVVVTWSLALTGSLIGFLLFNRSPAKIFMGDTGSLSVGAILGVLSIKVSSVVAISLFTRLCLPILLVVVPVLDIMTVTAIRIAHGHPVSRRGLDHSHHRLRRLGLTDSRVVSALCVLQTTACLTAIGLSVTPTEVAILAAPFVTLPFALVALFITDQSFEAEGPGALQGLPLVARLMLSLGYKRRVVEVGLDLLLITAAYFGSFMIRLNFHLTYPLVSSLLHSLPAVVIAAMSALVVTRTYRGMWRYTAIADAIRFAEGAALSGILVFVLSRFLPITYDVAIGVIFSLLLFNLLGLSRLSFSLLHRLLRTLATPGARVVVVGADAAAAEAAHHLLFDSTARKVTLLGLVDDDVLKVGKLIHGCKVLGPVADLDRIFAKRPFDELLLASSSLSSDTTIALRDFARRHSVVMYRFVAGFSRFSENGTLGALLAQQGPAAKPPRILLPTSSPQLRSRNKTTVNVVAAGRTPFEQPDPSEIETPRVLHVLTESVRGGIEEHALSILTALRAHGFEPHLAAPQTLLEQMDDELHAAKIRTMPLDKAGIFNRTSVSSFRYYLMSQNIDLVHSHTFLASMFASPLAQTAGVPATVETLHLPEVWRIGKWLKGSFWLDHQVGRFVDRYVAVSDAARNHLVRRKRILPDRIQVIHNGRDLVRFHPPSMRERAEARSALRLNDEQRVIVTLGRFEAQKGHSFLIDAFARLAPRWPSLIAIFAGRGELEADLLLQRDRAALGEHIRFPGMTRAPERILAAADLVVLPSLFEGLPLIAIEALGCALPMVATQIEGTREVILDEQTGLLVPPRDPAALAAAIERILTDRAFGTELGRRGREHVQSHFDVRMQIEATALMYRDLLRDKQGRPRPAERIYHCSL